MRAPACLANRMVMRARGLIILTGLCLQTFAIAGITGKISGRVTDGDTGIPLPGANIVITGTNLGAATDLEGEYYIINVRPGAYSVTASMIGYRTVVSNEVRALADHTVNLDFELSSTVLEGSEVVITAEREVIIMDRSASEVSVTAEDILAVPMVRDIWDYINLEAGIENDLIRGGGLDQTSLMVDGLAVMDNRSNQPVMMVNLSSVDQVSIIKGGFNAEYGNIRSGLINILTKEGSTTGYSGSVDFQYAPAQMKHGGYSLYDPNNYYLKSYLNPSVMWSGTQSGAWSEEMQESYPDFVGWYEASSRSLSDSDPSNDMTPEEARDLFMWYHQVEGSGNLGQDEGQYGHKPDFNLDVGFGGPVPLIGHSLGNMTFYFSYHNKNEMFALPASRDYYSESNTHLKLTMRPSTRMKVKLEGMYGEVKTIAASPEGSGNNWYLTSGTAILGSYLATSDAYAEGGGSALYWRSALNPFNVYRSMVGFSFDHVLSPSTFYNVRISNVRIKNACFGPDALRDTTTIRFFGNRYVDEAPIGFSTASNYTPSGDGMVFASLGSVARDNSTVSTLNAKFELTSQINKKHQVKIGFEANYDDLRTDYWSQFDYAPKNNYLRYYTAYPIRMGAFVQDKIEIKGLIANIGLRLDASDPNQDWYTVDLYSEFLSPSKKDEFIEQAPKERAKGAIKISPRLGVSHPISAEAKLYFSYGHFYSMPSSQDMYEIGFGTAYQGIDYLGNPSAEIPKTVAYELGVEYDISRMILLHLSGYYKDVSDQIGYVGYTSIDGSVNYTTTENNNYEDIRGFEIRVQKRYGRWFTGWANYNYIVQTWGYFGRDHYYEDLRSQLRYGYQNPKQEKPLARPFFRANLAFQTPKAWGPELMGARFLEQVQLDFLLGWKSGEYLTWDPLDTYELQNNLQWKSQYSVDMRIGKQLARDKANVHFFMDIANVFNLEYISMQGFDGGDDWREYLRSLHLPMYNGEEYLADGLTGGHDRVGDIKSDDKDYINMPNRQFLTYLNPRRITLGLRVNF